MREKKHVEVLMLEDNEDDASLIQMELEKAGYFINHKRVQTEEEFKRNLSNYPWDVVISDYNMPGFNGIEALNIVRKMDPDMPFILVSGTVGEEFAVESVIAGAHDYVMKDNLKRIPVAVQREIRNKKLRDEKRLSDQKIRESLKEKDVMLKEIHHRVKNNLAVISALLTMQSDYVEDEQSRKMFQDSVSRIKSMALIHEKLYQSEMLAQIEIGAYLEELVKNIKETYSKDDTEIDVCVTTENLTMDITRAIPCGLIVNELLANAFKHAFPGKTKGRIHLNLEKCKDPEKYCLEISDDGVGVGDQYIKGEKSSLGYTIIRGLARQISADLHVDNREGTTVSLVFAC